MDVGKKIRELREKRGLEQLELADKINISQSKMNKIETGYQKRLEPEILKDIAKILGVTTDYLLDFTDEPTILINEPTRLDLKIKRLIYLLIGNQQHPFLAEIQDTLFTQLEEVSKKYKVNIIEGISTYNPDPKKGIPEQLVKKITEIDDDYFKVELIEELQGVAHKFYLEFNPSYELGIRQPQPEELENIIKYEHISYQGQILTNEERLRILEMLRILFPDKQNRK